tara:strand:+ start:667 stop:813 length:147 start_codon:yes stop_codon:yes gene_type:complete
MYNESGNRCLVRKKELYILTAIHLKYILTWMLIHTRPKVRKKKEREDA